MNVIAYISLHIIWQNKNGLKPWHVKHEQYDKKITYQFSVIELVFAKFQRNGRLILKRIFSKHRYYSNGFIIVCGFIFPCYDYLINAKQIVFLYYSYGFGSVVFVKKTTHEKVLFRYLSFCIFTIKNKVHSLQLFEFEKNSIYVNIFHFRGYIFIQRVNWLLMDYLNSLFAFWQVEKGGKVQITICVRDASFWLQTPPRSFPIKLYLNSLSSNYGSYATPWLNIFWYLIP